MGSLVPGVFAGYRRPVPNSPLLGAMWFSADDPLGFTRLRQHCASSVDGSNPLRYGWLQHNGRDYGVRFIQEHGWNLTIAHLAHTESLDLPNGSETVRNPPSGFSFRIRGSGEGCHNVSLLIYWAAQRDEINPADLEPSSPSKIQPPVFEDCPQPSIEEEPRGHVHVRCGTMRDQWHILPVRGLPERSRPRRRGHRRRRRSNASKSETFRAVWESSDLGRIHLRRGQATVGTPSEVKSVIETWLSENRHRRLEQLRVAHEQERAALSSLDAASNSFDEYVQRWLQQPAERLPTIVTTEFDDHLQDDASGDRQKGEPFTRSRHKDPQGVNLLVAQLTLQTPFEIIVTSNELMKATRFASMLEQAEKRFEERFQEVFPRIRASQFNTRQVAQAQEALAGLLGGISYFYGSLIVEENQTGVESEPISITQPLALISAVPSENKFPRGFLWDEGFHHLLIQRWDPELSFICLHSWLQLTMESGWIPRELAPGIEARSRFPKDLTKLLVQSERVANPPTLLIPLHRHWRMLQEAFPLVELDTLLSLCAEGGDAALVDYTAMILDKSIDRCETVIRVADTAQRLTDLALQKMARYLLWLNKTQEHYGWFGRNLTTLRVQDGDYPTTLASGFDDFPRAPVASAREAHVDLLSWILYGIGRLVAWVPYDGRAVDSHKHILHELRSLEKSLQRRLFDIHWSSKADMFCDMDQAETSASESASPWQHHCHLGYPTLLPLSLGLLPVNATQTRALLEAAADPRQLWSPYGLRSLSATDPFYMRGDRYWTGPIWVPMNYLTLAALKEKYARLPGPSQKSAAHLYERTRQAIIETVLREHERTGFFWEHYDPATGRGGGGHPFTGWTALVVLIMDEDYSGIIDSDGSFLVN
ncbi:hypothetical protein CCYA_CCYA01G0050 [Cyanidiococcus yangmingshanensis]|nr:hypothetical protein CCYA_CCYA01G0050 [Cyanidiococcus yangmingshanensis]